MRDGLGGGWGESTCETSKSGLGGKERLLFTALIKLSSKEEVFEFKSLQLDAVFSLEKALVNIDGLDISTN